MKFQAFQRVGMMNGIGMFVNAMNALSDKLNSAIIAEPMEEFHNQVITSQAVSQILGTVFEANLGVQSKRSEYSIAKFEGTQIYRVYDHENKSAYGLWVYKNPLNEEYSLFIKIAPINAMNNFLVSRKWATFHISHSTERKISVY